MISLFSKRRSFLFLGGVIVTMVQGMIVYRLMGWLMGYQTFNLAYLLFSLFLCCLYIIFDTQLIVEKAERGEKDVAAHAMVLFIDLFELFIRILIILLKMSEDKEERKKKK